MRSKEKIGLIDILNNSLLVFDTNVLLNIYKYSLVSSKRILDHMHRYEENIWIPAQVKKEFIRNQEKARSINLYKNLNTELSRHIRTKKEELFVHLSEFEKKRFPRLDIVKDKLEEKFLEMEDIIKDYKEEISEETGVYKEFVTEADYFLNTLLQSDKVGKELMISELIKVLGEGELRYKYSIPPGYKDAEKKKGIDKYGDLILWKQLLNKAVEAKQKYIIFVTNDIKEDWFQKDNKVEIPFPRQELISEFQELHLDKEIVIIPFGSFVQEISDTSNASDKELLLELRANNLIRRLPKVIFKELIEKELQELNQDDIHKKILNITHGAERHYIETMQEMYNLTVDIPEINIIDTRVEEEKIIYFLRLDAKFEYDIVSYSNGIISYGTLVADMSSNIELERSTQETELEFIERISRDGLRVGKPFPLIMDNEQYIWGADEDVSSITGDEFEEIYTTCPSCGEGISKSNATGNGFCYSCTATKDL